MLSIRIMRMHARLTKATGARWEGIMCIQGRQHSMFVLLPNGDSVMRRRGGPSTSSRTLEHLPFGKHREVTVAYRHGLHVMIPFPRRTTSIPLNID